MKNKRGQIFLLAAIMIVIALIGLSTTNFAIVKTAPKAVSDISSDLSNEPAEIIDYGIYNSQDTETLMDDFLTSNDKFAPYFLKKTNNANVIFVYGNKNNIKAVEYNTQSTGTITANIGGRINWENFGTFAEKITVTPTPDGEIIVTLLSNDYKFKLRDNEMFYFIIIQEKEGERYIGLNQ